jgi:hypothetical protein
VTVILAKNITGVTETKEGVFCIAPAAPINAGEETIAASPEVSYSSGGIPGVVAVNAQHTNCPAGQFEVDTYTAPSTPSSNYAFTVIVP